MMFDRSPETYVAMLAVMKVNAAYVPLDTAFPIERVRFILDDADVSTIVSMSSFAKRLSGLQVDKIFLDSERPAIDAQAADPLTDVVPPIDRSATSSTHRALPVIRRASVSDTQAFAISCALPPSFMAMRPAIASIRACRSRSISQSRRSGCR